MGREQILALIRIFEQQLALGTEGVVLGTWDIKYDKAEVIPVKCDVHTWMKSFVVVTDSAKWVITGADGSFKLEGLPPGEYELSWWHEDLGKGKTEKVKVEAGKEAVLEHKVSAEKKAGGARRR